MPIGTLGAKARGGRALLNLAPFQTTAAIVAEVEDTRGWKKDKARGKKLPKDAEDARWEIAPESTLQIANCDRSIAFEVDWESAQGRANTLHKLDTMIGVLSAFREAVEDEQRLYVKRIERYSKKRKS